MTEGTGRQAFEAYAAAQGRDADDPTTALVMHLIGRIVPIVIEVLNAEKVPPAVAAPALAEVLAFVAVSCLGQTSGAGRAGETMELFIEVFAEEAREFARYVDQKMAAKEQ